MRLKLYIFLCLNVLAFNLDAQNQTNSGTDFWLAYTEVYKGSTAKYELNLSSAVKTSGTISLSAEADNRLAFTINPGTITTVQLPADLVHNPTNQKVVKRAIHIQAKNPITVQANTLHNFSSESTICLPYDAAGSEYMITTLPNFYERTEGNFESEFVVVCGPDPIQVEIIPSCKTANGNPKDSVITVDLKAGEVFQVKASLDAFFDLSGTTVRATNGSDKFMVFNGNKFTTVHPKHCAKGTSGDPLYEIALPTSSWGSDFILLRPKAQYVNLYHVISYEDNCQIYVNGKLTKTMQAGEVYEGQFPGEFMYIQTSQKAAVYQLMASAGGLCNPSRIGDPSMCMIQNNAQMNLTSATFSIPSYMKTNYVSVLTKASNQANIKLDGQALNGFKTVHSNNDYVYLIFEVAVGAHTLTSSGGGFIAYHHGVQEAETIFTALGVSLALSEPIKGSYPNATFYFLNDEKEKFEEKMVDEYASFTIEIAQFLYDFKSTKAWVNGYTSTPGEIEYNLNLSQERAIVVKEQIIAQIQQIYAEQEKPYSFDEDRIIVTAFGEDSLHLVVTDDDNDELDDEATRKMKQAKNRRVEVVFEQLDK